MPETSTLFDRCFRILLFGFIGITVLYRFFHLGEQSFWLDEIYTARDTAEHLSFQQVVSYVTHQHQLHPPLYFLVVNGFLKLTHLSGEAGYRAISLLSALLTIPVLLAIGKKLKSEWLGLGFVSVYSSSTICLWFSLEARYYSFSFLLSTLLLLVLLAQLQNPSRWKIALMALLSLLFLYTTYFSVFLIPSVYLFYLFHDGRWSKIRFFETFISGLVVSILFFPLFTIATGQSSLTLEFIKKPQLTLLREAWVFFFKGGSMEYYLFAVALAASPFLVTRYQKTGGFGLLLFLQISLFIVLGFVYSYTVLPILHHKYLVFIHIPLLFLILLNFYLLLPRKFFLGMVVVLSAKNLVFNSYLAIGEVNKSPYRQYLENIAQNDPQVPIVTNVVPFAGYYSETNNYNLNLLPDTLSLTTGSNRNRLLRGFWEFHMHGPFQFYQTLPPDIKDSLTPVGEAKFDVISYVTRYAPKRSCFLVQGSDELNKNWTPNALFNKSAYIVDVPPGNYRLIFTARSGEEWKKAGLSIETDNKKFRFEMLNLPKFYSLPIVTSGEERLRINLFQHPELPRPVLGDLYLIRE